MMMAGRKKGAEGEGKKRENYDEDERENLSEPKMKM